MPDARFGSAEQSLVSGRARLLAAILPAEKREPPAPVPPAQRQQLQELLGPLVNHLVQLEAALAARPDVPAEVRDLVHQSRTELRASQSQLEHALIGPKGPGEGPRFVSQMGPAGRPHSGMMVSHGPDIMALQKILNREKIPIAFTGNYDPPTQKGVYKLQERHGLSRTGVVDADTLNLLNQLAARHHLGGHVPAR